MEQEYVTFSHPTRILQGAIQPQEPRDGGERAGSGRGPDMRRQRTVQTRGRLRLGADTEQVGSNCWIYTKKSTFIMRS